MALCTTYRIRSASGAWFARWLPGGDPVWTPDADRALCLRGVAVAQATLRGLQQAGFEVELVSSP
jgi:hypothetical protein